MADLARRMRVEVRHRGRDGGREDTKNWTRRIVCETIMAPCAHVPGMSEWRPGVTVYIDASALEAIDGRRGDATRSEWIRRAIAEALSKEAG